MKTSIKLALLITVAVTAFTAWRDGQQSNDPSSGFAERAPVRQTTLGAGGGNAPTHEMVGAQIDAAATKPIDLFSAKLWLRETPKPAQSAPAKPVSPSAPALPFEFSGLWVEGPIRYVVLVSAGQQLLFCTQCNTPGTVRVGDVVLGQYRLESLDATQVVFTYLPLKQRQSLMLESL